MAVCVGDPDALVEHTLIEQIMIAERPSKYQLKAVTEDNLFLRI